MTNWIAHLRIALTFGGAGALLMTGFTAFLADQPTLGWACAAGAAGILYRELLHVLEQKANA